MFQGVSAACLVFVLVPFCAFPSALVRPHLAAGRMSARFSSRVSRRCGCAAAVGCLLAHARGGCGVGDVVSISSRSAYRLFATGSGEAVMSGVPSCLLGGGDDVMCCVLLFRLPCDCLPLLVGAVAIG